MTEYAHTGGWLQHGGWSGRFGLYQVPATWYVRQLGSAARRRHVQRPLFGGAVAAFSALIVGLITVLITVLITGSWRSTSGFDRPHEAAFGDAELAFGFVNGADQVVTIRADVELGQRGDARAVLRDVVGDGRQFRGGGFRGARHGFTVPAA